MHVGCECYVEQCVCISICAHPVHEDLFLPPVGWKVIGELTPCGHGA